MIKITNVTMADLPAVLTIERAGFSPAEAGTPVAFRDRITKISDTFLVARDGNQVVGFIVGPVTQDKFVTDEMYRRTPKNLPTGGHQLVLSIAVAPEYRRQGVGSRLLSALEKLARNQRRSTISLDSLAENFPFYLVNGFKKAGISDSNHAGETWYHLVKELSSPNASSD